MKSIVNPINIKEIMSKLKSDKLEHSEFIGIINAIIYSKDVFNHNKDLKGFASDVFLYECPKYVLGSRTLISAKITRKLVNFDSNELDLVKKRMLKYFNELEGKYINLSKKKNANDKLSVWLKEL